MVDKKEPFFQSEAILSLGSAERSERAAANTAPMAKVTARQEAMERLSEMVQDHLAIPRPSGQEHMRQLQDDLMPYLMDGARQAWMASSPLALPTGKSPYELSHPVYRYLQAVTEGGTQRIGAFNSILQDMGVYDLLDDVASSADVAMLSAITIDPHEVRLL